MTRSVVINNFRIGGGNPLVLIAGPCVIESEEATLRLAQKLRTITEKLGIPFIFKASYDKANRTSVNSYRGPGLEEGLRILAEVKKKVSVPILSDVHHPSEVDPAGRTLDVIQIPAFLCRQTDLITAAAHLGKPVNIKKGQFLSPDEIGPITQKITSSNNQNILLTERGTTFGYNNLVVDMRSLIIMRKFRFPIIFDATHSVQLPGARGNASGGEREFIPPLAMASAAVGIDGLYLEVHENPEKALCAGPNSLRISEVPSLLKKIKKICAISRKWGEK
ncbi:MAG: 3-deoxy-8-phosphooctulonate synthase [Deltaproteobacteria bacterium]|nr:3-deoxy-8-phosphooctulonate synthase [Deltaproteobacteria bacterium]